jgi:hypothetical protein
MRFVAIVLVIASIGLACVGQKNVSRPVQPRPASPAREVVANGVWGGEHIRIDVSDSGADIEFDCARGIISQPLALDAQGRFKFQGTYKPETPAPASADGGSANSGVTATYTGVLTGSSLRIEVSIEGQDTPRTFDLVQGDQGHLAKCS